jgi:transposase
MHHWVDRRIEAHIFLCVMALQIQRLMRQRLHKASIKRSPERILEKLSFQRTVEATLNGQKVQGLDIPKPLHKHLANPAL